MFSAPRFWRPKSSSGASSFSPLGSYSRPMASSRPLPSTSLKNRPAVRASATSSATAWPGPDLPTADGTLGWRYQIATLASDNDLDELLEEADMSTGRPEVDFPDGDPPSDLQITEIWEGS